MALRLFTLLGLAAGFLVGCAPKPAPSGEETDPTAKAREIIAAAVKANGLSDFDRKAVRFRFRDKQYRYQRADGRYRYERWWKDSTSGREIRDVLDNDAIIRYVDGEPAPLTVKQEKAYRGGVNSVVYFAFMPWALKDPAVRPEYMGRETIRGREYDKVGITFAAENGGDDSGDVFRYWFDPQTHELTYLAYVEPGNKYPRFREAFNSRRESGFTVRDYHNYRPPEEARTDVDSLAGKFERGELELLSEIISEDFVEESIN